MKTEDDAILITVNELQEAMHIYWSLYDQLPVKVSRYVGSFVKFVKHDDQGFTPTYNSRVIVTQESYDRIKMLLGPNAHTLFKVYVANIKERW